MKQEEIVLQLQVVHVDILEAEVAPWYENASVKELAQQLATVLILAIVIFGAFLPLLKEFLFLLDTHLVLVQWLLM